MVLSWHCRSCPDAALFAATLQPLGQVFLREHSSGTYTVLPYYLSKMAVEADCAPGDTAIKTMELATSALPVERSHLYLYSPC